MAFNFTYAENSITVSTTELSLISGTSTLQTVTDDGIFIPLLDLSDMIDADQMEFRIYEKTRAADAKIVIYKELLTDAPGVQKGWSPPDVGPLGHGWDMTVKRVGGTDITLVYRICRIF
jgi:hypothetical protein